MKKHLLFGAILIGGLAMAQTGKVGVQTDSPTETFQVEGTTRITDLPKNKEGKIHTDNQGNRDDSKNQQFNATKTVVVDKNGVLGIVEGLPQIKRVQDIETQPFAPQRKCTGGKLVAEDGNESKRVKSKELKFGNYAFQAQQGGHGRIDIFMKTVDGTAKKVKVSKLSGNGGDKGEVTLGADYSTIADQVSHRGSESQNGTVIVAGEDVVTFNYFIRTMKDAKTDNEYPNTYSLCVEQMVY